jgi:hypothetical protein
MIQRVQTIFLLAAAILQLLFINLPLARFVLPELNIEFKAKGFISEGEVQVATTALLILCWSVAVLSAITIFLHKNRILQIRFCIYNMLLNIGLIGMLALYLNNFVKANSPEAQSFLPVLAIPVVSIILLFLAFRGIRKDELLIKAYDRLR